MQSVLEELVRWFGYGVLRLATFRRYQGGREGDRLPEGATGLAVILLLAGIVYASL